MFPTIAWRELTVKARQEREFLQRVLLAAVAVVLVLVLLTFAELLRMPRGTGEFMYKFMGWTCMILGGLEGVRQTLDSLSREKREGTLGLLFLTRVTSLDVVMGKWVVLALAAFYHLLAIFPALAIPIILGGITFGEFARLLLCVGNVLFVGLAVGMLVSAWGREENEVWVAGLTWLTLLMTGPLGWTAIVSSVKGSAVGGWLTYLSPLQSWLLAPHAAYTVAPGQYWSALAFSHLVGWLLLVSAAWSMAVVWRRIAQASPPRALRWPVRLLQPLVEALRWFEKRAWRDLLGFSFPAPLSRFIVNDSPPAGLLVALVAVGGVALALLNYFTSTNFWVVYLGAGLFYAAHWLVRFWAAAQSCQVLRQLRESGWLFSLLSVPQQPYELPKALFQSQQPALRMVFSLLMAMELLWLACLGFVCWPGHHGLLASAMLLWLVAAVILWADLQAVHAAGLWHGLNLNQPAQATRRTIFQVLLLPLLAAPLGLFCMGAAIPILMVVKAAIFHHHFRERLMRDFHLGIEQTQVFAHESLAEKTGRWLGAKKAPPRLLGTGPACVSCGRGVGNAAYCPFCGYRQPWGGNF